MVTPPARFDPWLRIKKGDPVPPPPPELVAWASQTTMATLAGTIYGAGLAHVTRERAGAGTHPQARRAVPLCIRCC